MGSKYNGLKVIPTGLLGLLLITMMHGPTFWADGMRGFTSGAVSPAPVTVVGLSSTRLELSASLNATSISKQEVIGIDLRLTNLGTNATTIFRGRQFVMSLIYVFTTLGRVFSAWNLSPNCNRLQGRGVTFNLQPNTTLVLSGTIYWPTTEWCYLGSEGPGNLSAVIPGSYVMEFYYPPDITLTPILITVNQQTSLIGGFIAESDLTLILLAVVTAIISLNVVVTLLLRSEIRKMRKEHVLEERDAKTKNVNDKS